ncbi:MAG: hypothetical protein AAGE52_34770 [Myxococcota bacterium]
MRTRAGHGVPKLVALAMGAWFFAAPVAEAKDMSGRFGLGADTSLGWNAVFAENAFSFDAAIPGLSAVYQVSDRFGIQALFGVGFAKEEEPDNKAVVWNTGVRGIVNLGLSESVNLGFALGLGVSGIRTNPEGADSTSAIWVGLELALRPEWFVTDWFSFHTQVGIGIAILDDELGGSDGSVGVDLFGSANLLGNAGFTFWF